MNEDGFETWLVEHQDYLRNYARKRVADPEAGEDLVQETCLAAWRAWDRFEGRSSVKTWMTSILRRKIIDYYHQRDRERDIFPDLSVSESRSEEDGGEGMSGAEWVMMRMGSGITPEDALERAEFWRALSMSLETLPGVQRKVFVHKELEGLSTPEVCALEQITANHLWVILHRARRGLRDSLARQGFVISLA